jgi:hypothetical protein
MKKLISPLMLLALVATVGTSLTSCKGKRKKATQEVVGTEIRSLPCQGPRYTTDDKFFRASQIGTSSDISLAKEKALTLAKQVLAGSIQTQMRSVTDRYVNEREIGNRADFSQKFENLTREVIDQTLTDIRTACEQLTQIEDGRFRCFIALEINKQDLLNGINNRISRQELIQLEYDKSQFERIFNEEMRKIDEDRR